MTNQDGLTTSDRIAIQHLLVTNQDGDINLQSLTDEEKAALTRWWLVSNKKQGKDQKTDDILAEIQEAYKDDPKGIITDLKYLFETNIFNDAIVDAAITKGLVDKMRTDSSTKEAAANTNTTTDTREIIKILLERKIAQNQMRKIAENRAANKDEYKGIINSIKNTDPKINSTDPRSVGGFSPIQPDLSPIVDTLTAQSGVQFNKIQKEIITSQLTTMAVSGALDLTNPQELTVHFVISAAEANPLYANNNPVYNLNQNIDQAVTELKETDIDRSNTASIANKESRQAIIALNQSIQNELLNNISPEQASEESIRITKEVAEYLAKNPNATPQQTQKIISDQIQKATNKAPKPVDIDAQTITAIIKNDPGKIEVIRASYATQIINDIALQSGGTLDQKTVAQIANELAQNATYTRQNSQNALEHLVQKISKETGIDPEKIREQVDVHAAAIQRIDRLNYGTAIINIPAGSIIDPQKIDLKNEAAVKAALAKALYNTQNLNPRDIDRILKAQETIKNVTAKLEQNQAFQIAIRRIDVTAIYSDQQNVIYKAFFEAYKNELDNSRPTQRGVQAIVLINSLPHQTIISPTAIALANMGVTVDMFDKLIKDPSKSPSFQQLLKNHKNQMSLLRDQLEQLEGSQLYQELAPDKLKLLHDYSKLSFQDAAILAALPGNSGKTLVQTYNSSTVKLLADIVAPKLFPYANAVLHPIDKIQDFFTSRAAQALSRALLGGKTVSQIVGGLLVRGLAKVGINIAFGAATAGVGLVIGFAIGRVVGFFQGFAKNVFGEEVKARDLALAPVVTVTTLLGGLTSLLSVSSVLSSGLLATMASSILLGLIIYMASFVMAPILSTIAHLESGTVGTATTQQTYSGQIIDGCNSIWPTNSGIVIQGPKGPFSHSRVEAIDIKVPTGTQVFSISSGTVTYNSYYNVYGNNVRIQSVSPDGRSYEVWYGHLAAPSHLSVGDTVKTGDPIAFSGATSSDPRFGNPHLHLEYRGMLYNECPAGGVPVPYGCYNWTNYPRCNVKY